MNLGSKYIKLFRVSSLSTKVMIISGATVCILLIFLMLFGKYFTPYDPYAFTEDIISQPSLKHPMGTDRLGRDILSRVIVGTYWSLSTALISVLIALAAGTFLGAISGYIGGYVDGVLSLIMDALWIFPTFVLALVVVLVLGPGLFNTALAIAIVAIPAFFRVIRSQTLTIKERAFIDAERIINAEPLYIIRRHIAPFYTSSLIVLACLRLAAAILAISGLGFLGLGVPPPISEWGTDLAVGRFEILGGAWWLCAFPGLMILISILGFNLLGEGLDDMLKSVIKTRK
jgi:peptide/nickel transport system permease protein